MKNRDKQNVDQPKQDWNEANRVEPKVQPVPVYSTGTAQVQEQIAERNNEQVDREDPVSFLQRLNQRLKHVASPTPLSNLTEEVDNYIRRRTNKKIEDVNKK